MNIMFLMRILEHGGGAERQLSVLAKGLQSRGHQVTVAVLYGSGNDFEAELVEAGIPAEDARYLLPNSCCTKIIVTMNVRELLHFFNMRLCSRAQKEIRELASKMLSLVKKEAPDIFEKAGPTCVSYGYCMEEYKECALYKKLIEKK